MHITRYTDYSLRVLVYLAVQGDELATIQQIADSYEISRNHLMKVVHQLNKKGLHRNRSWQERWDAPANGTGGH